MKLLMAMALTIFSFGAFAADGIRTQIPPESTKAEVIGNLLASRKTPTEAKALLGAITNGQTYEQRVSIISVDEDAALGQYTISFQIGIDDITDNDNGWSSVKEIRAYYQRDSKGHFYNLKKVEISTIAG